jgi:hypothetical protein
MESGKFIVIKKIALLVFLVIAAQACSVHMDHHFVTQCHGSENYTDQCLSQETDSGDEDQIDQINKCHLAHFPEYKSQDSAYITSLFNFVVAVWQPPKLS